MRLDLILALLAVVPSTLLVSGAPAKGTHTKSTHTKTVKSASVEGGNPLFDPSTNTITLPKANLNYNAYHQALLKANNLTHLEINARLNIGIAAASNSVTKIYCVGSASNPERVMIFPDTHNCQINGWTQFYSFISYIGNYKINPKPWCYGDAFNPYRAMHMADTNCGQRGWIHRDAGYATSESKGLHSYIAKSADRMFMNPFTASNMYGLTYDTTLQHQAILLRPTPDMVAFLTKHARDYPSIYKRSIENNNVDRNVHLYGQIMIEAMGSLSLSKSSAEYYKIPDQSTFNNRVEKAGVKSQNNKVKIELGAKKKDADGVYRHQVTMYFVDSAGKNRYICAIIVPSGKNVKAEHVKSAFSEALRDHTTVMLAPMPDKGNTFWLIAPLYNNRGDLPVIYFGV
ncbi:hypothetical protein BGX34_005270 [Mortierella sp. NVP85]|nr:hypothetical protein BGX34_005270 [Mortierella sp. NVP85]